MSGLIHVGAWTGEEYVGHEGLLLLFEPLDDAFRELQANLADNEETVFVNLALGAEKGSAVMHRSLPSHSSSILAPKKHHDLYPEIKFNGTEQVRVSTLDAEIESRGLEGRFDRLVIDVQGYELEVLKGATRTLPSLGRVKCEVNWDEVYEGCALLDQVDAFLEDAGFERAGLIPHDSGMCGDAYYTR